MFPWYMSYVETNQICFFQKDHLSRWSLKSSPTLGYNYLLGWRTGWRFMFTDVFFPSVTGCFSHFPSAKNVHMRLTWPNGRSKIFIEDSSRIPSRERSHIPPWENENPLQMWLLMGYVCFREGRLFAKNHREMIDWISVTIQKLPKASCCN